MSTFKLAILTVVLFSAKWSAAAKDHTHIDNHSTKWTIIASLSYPGGHSQFTNRVIPPGGSDSDAYEYVDHVDVTVQVQGAPFSNSFTILSDSSIVAVDTPGNEFGVDFWLNDGSGNPNTGYGILTTIYGPGPPPSPPQAPPAPPASPPPAPPAPVFITKSLSESLGDGERLATLYDVSGNEDTLMSVLPSNEYCLLVDGWVRSIVQRLAGLNSLYSGTEDDKPITCKLGIADNSYNDTDPEDAYDFDFVPVGADPGNFIANYVNSTLSLLDPVSDIQPRAFGGGLNRGQEKAIRALIAQWTLDLVDNGLKQQTLLTGEQGTRIDLQDNGGFTKTFQNDDGYPYQVLCHQVAVQIAGQVYSSVVFPSGQLVTAGGFRKALYLSLERAQIVYFVKPPKRYTGKYRWLLSLAAATAAWALIINAPQ